MKKISDSLIIENIDMDLASKLSDLVYIKDSSNPNLTDSNTLKQVYNEHGIGNISVIVLTILLIGMTIIGTIFFTIIKNLYSDDAVDLLDELPSNVVKKILNNVDVQTRNDINNLLNFPKNSSVTSDLSI